MPDDAMSKSVVSRVALIVRRCYCLHSRWVRQLDSYDPPEEKYGKYWTGAAIVCVTKRINPAEYIEVLFVATKPRWPEIRQIASEWALGLYMKHAKPHAFSYLNDFNIQLHAYELLAQRRDISSVLVDEEQEFDPLFIYSVAEANGLTELAKKYEEAALAKYLTSVHYDQIYKDVIPEKFKKAAIDLIMTEGAHA